VDKEEVEGAKELWRSEGVDRHAVESGEALYGVAGHHQRLCQQPTITRYRNLLESTTATEVFIR